MRCRRGGEQISDKHKKISHVFWKTSEIFQKTWEIFSKTWEFFLSAAQELLFVVVARYFLVGYLYAMRWRKNSTGVSLLEFYAQSEGNSIVDVIGIIGSYAALPI